MMSTPEQYANDPTPRTPPESGTLTTTAGDVEREARSRFFNAMEGLGVITFVLVVLWPFAFVFGVIGQSDGANTVANALLVLGAIYLLFVSPFLHKDTLTTWGLGNPLTLWRMLREGPPWKSAVIGTIVLALFIALNIANYLRWPDVAKFLNFNEVARALGAVEPRVQDFNQSFPGLFFVFGFGGFLAALIVTCAIRYDNFVSAFKTALKVSLPLLVLAFLAAFLQRGADALKGLSFSMWALGVLGYVFWGFVQQLLFSSYFGTRFRKAFGPSQNPNNVIPPDKRTAPVFAFGIGASVVAVVLALSSIYYLYGSEGLDPGIYIWLAIFIFPIGAVYGYYFCLDKKRLLVATLCASCFGLIHIDSYGLVVVTWGLGIILVYVFMEEKNRNLVALGFIHGLLGSTFGSLFSKGESGVLEVDYSVGPWNVDEPAYGALLIPMLFVLVYVGLMLWCAKSDSGERTMGGA